MKPGIFAIFILLLLHLPAALTAPSKDYKPPPVQTRDTPPGRARKGHMTIERWWVHGARRRNSGRLEGKAKVDYSGMMGRRSGSTRRRRGGSTKPTKKKKV